MPLALIVLSLLAAGSEATGGNEVACDIQANLIDRDPGGTNVRQGAGTQFLPIGRLPIDRTDVVSVTAAKGSWLKISRAVDEDGQTIFAKTGWVFAPLLGMSTSWNPDDPRAQGSHALHAGPSEKSRAIGRIAASSQVTLESCAGRWAKVKHQGRSGWLAPDAQCSNTKTECS